LKENVIIGRKIPVGTGALDYVNPSQPDSDLVEEIATEIELAI
jgi:hypothetical protein